MTRVAQGHAYMAREKARRLGLDVGAIPGDGDVGLVTVLDTDTGARSTMAGDGGWLRAFFVVGRAHTDWLPDEIGAPYFPLETAGWPADWVAEIRSTG